MKLHEVRLANIPNRGFDDYINNNDYDKLSDDLQTAQIVDDPEEAYNILSNGKLSPAIMKKAKYLIARHARLAFLYATRISGERFELGEKVILNSKYKNQYKKFIQQLKIN